MSEHNEVRHEGVITSIDGDMAQVTILVKSACAECHIKGACSLS
ncbi:MAG: SoxR reducing system RseC family protein, partial [Sphingobacteriales bacterium]|nr:SoxR reducing system RseC family protein [Sphingobacteriales bacterium]